MRTFRYQRPHWGIHGAKIFSLLGVRKGLSLFPNLRELQLESWPVAATEASILFTPTLRSIIISDKSPMSCRRKNEWGRLNRLQQERVCFHSLVRRCTKLRVLKVFSTLNPSDTGTLYPFLNLQGLETLDLEFAPRATSRTVHPAVVNKLLKLERLTRLHFDAWLLFLGLGNDTKSSSNSLRNLEYLKTSGDTHSLMCLFGILHAPRLSHVAMRFDDQKPFSDKTWQKIKDVVGTLVHNVGRTLEKLEMATPHNYSDKSSAFTSIVLCEWQCGSKLKH